MFERFIIKFISLSKNLLKDYNNEKTTCSNIHDTIISLFK